MSNVFCVPEPISGEMKLNENIKIVGAKVILVPYERQFVTKLVKKSNLDSPAGIYAPFPIPRYHNWMKNEDLRDLTASEPLTLEEEYEMQRSWRNDEDSKEICIYHSPAPMRSFRYVYRTYIPYRGQTNIPGYK